MMTWEEAARYSEEVFGSFVCWEGRYFICTECGEPLYECDWEGHDFSDCPVCGYMFEEGEE
jgi:hypothetical protein